MPRAPMSVKSDRPMRPGGRSRRKITSRLGSLGARHLARRRAAFGLNPPPVLGLGQGAGYSLFVEDRAGAGYGELQQAVNALQTAAVKTPGMGVASEN